MLLLVSIAIVSFLLGIAVRSLWPVITRIYLVADDHLRELDREREVVIFLLGAIYHQPVPMGKAAIYWKMVSRKLLEFYPEITKDSPSAPPPKPVL